MRGLAAVDRALVARPARARAERCSSNNGSRSWPRAAKPRWTPPKPSGAASSAICTTAPSSGSSPWPWTSGWPRSGWSAATTPAGTAELVGQRPRRGQAGDQRAARAGPRHPPGRADRPRARRRPVGARRPQPGPGRPRRRSARTPAAGRRGGRLLRGGRGAHQRRQAQRRHAVRVTCRSDAGRLVVVEVTDDGVGGASVQQAGGLAGLADRVTARRGHRCAWPARPAGRPPCCVELPCGS